MSQQTYLQRSIVMFSRLVCILFLISRTYPVHAVPMAQFTPPTTITLRVYEWDGDVPSRRLCAVNSQIFGCTAYPNRADRAFPLANPVSVNIEELYLLDVVSRETNPAVFAAQTLKAQAIAARSFAFWHLDNGVAIDSTSQAFIRYTFEQQGNTPANSNTPCASNNLSAEQIEVCTATSGREYLSLSTETRPIFAAYSANIPDPTSTYPVDATYGRHQYLKGVAEPISSATGGCGVALEGNPYGMSQKGASRWERGNLCYTGNPLRPWSVQWQRVEQILFHYYTGVHLRNNTGTRLSPDYRWNPLNIIGMPAVFRRNLTNAITVQIQNTGTLVWSCSFPNFNFSLRYRWLGSSSPEQLGTGSVSVCSLAPGEATTVNLNINDVPTRPGTYLLRFDIDVTAANGNFRFSTQSLPWSTYDATVCVEACSTYVPMTIR